MGIETSFSSPPFSPFELLYFPTEQLTFQGAFAFCLMAE